MKYIIIALICLVYHSSAFAVGTVGTDGSCYFIRTRGGYYSTLEYGYYQGGTSSTLGLPIARYGGLQHQNPTWGEWYTLESTVQKWVGNQWVLVEWLFSGQFVSKAIFDATMAISDGGTLPSSPPVDMCNPCSPKQNQSNYKLDIRSEEIPVNLSTSCYENCKTTAEELWEDCISGQCVSSVKHTFTGEPCTGQPSITDLEPNQPERCDDEISLKISQCGGSINVHSFNFENCTGTCTPDSCSEAYALKVQSCGGVMAIATWDDATCKGTCVNDPFPQEPGPADKPPVEIERKEVVNSDGSKEVSRTTTQYNSETNTTYTTTTTTTYNSAGDQTNQISSTTISPGKPDNQGQGEEEPKETFGSIGISGFGESYAPGGYDIPVRFNTFLNTVKSSGLFSFSSSFFNSMPGGGSPTYTINGGRTFGSHSIDLSETMTTGLSVLKSILMACFGFLSIRAIIMKR